MGRTKNANTSTKTPASKKTKKIEKTQKLSLLENKISIKKLAN